MREGIKKEKKKKKAKAKQSWASFPVSLVDSGMHLTLYRRSTAKTRAASTARSSSSLPFRVPRSTIDSKTKKKNLKTSFVREWKSRLATKRYTQRVSHAPEHQVDEEIPTASAGCPSSTLTLTSGAQTSEFSKITWFPRNPG